MDTLPSTCLPTHLHNRLQRLSQFLASENTILGQLGVFLDSRRMLWRAQCSYGLKHLAALRLHGTQYRPGKTVCCLTPSELLVRLEAPRCSTSILHIVSNLSNSELSHAEPSQGSKYLPAPLKRFELGTRISKVHQMLHVAGCRCWSWPDTRESSDHCWDAISEYLWLSIYTHVRETLASFLHACFALISIATNGK